MPQRVEGNIEIEAPVETVYSYWETLENLPNFMANVQEVTPTGPDTTHWRVKGPLGKTLEWEAQMNYSDPPGGKVGEVASRAVANPKLQLEQDLRNLKQILEGEATPEDIQRRPAATTVQSGVVAFLTSGAGLVVLGAGLLLLLVLRRRRRSGGRGGGARGKSRITFEF